MSNSSENIRLFYVYGGCSPRLYKEYVERRGARAQQQSQKYNQLLMEGFVRNGVDVRAISGRPINRQIDSTVFFPGETDEENGVRYRYVPFINYPVLRHLSVFFSVLFYLLGKGGRGSRDRILCDALNLSASMAAWIAGRIRRIPTYAIITDVPCHRPKGVKPSKAEWIGLWLMRRFDGYLLLTQAMSELVNPKNRPCVVLEGHADITMAQVENRLEDKAEARIILYAGTLRRVYGIEMLVRGFLQADIPNAQLHIYGDGDFAAELKALAAEDPRILYHGIAPNAKIVAEELRASLLVNPRPTNEDYTKYSFPSKNMEYMASGTPILTTRLPGMPDEYLPYVYLIREETAEGIAQALGSVMAQTPEELHQMGSRAKEFILTRKNNMVQAEKILELLR